MSLHLVVALGVGLPALATFQLDELDVALLEAARAGDTKKVEALVEDGADIEVRVAPKATDDAGPESTVPDIDAGATPLILAATEGHADTVELLIKEGAYLSAKDDAEFSALERAAYAGHVGTVELLLDNGASVAGNSLALLWGARQGRQRVVRALLQAGANPNAPMPVGWTPLMLAAESGHAGIVMDLIARGADVDAMSNNGYTALRCARERGQDEIVEILTEAGATLDPNHDD